MVIEQFQDEKILTQVNEGSSPHADDLGPNENFQNFYLEKPSALLCQKNNTDEKDIPYERTISSH